jgi:hypothetical protein
MNYEICFSLFQTMKIINHFDETKLTYFDALKQKQIIFKQSTNVCSYFFVKMLFLFHYYKLLDFWEKTGFMFYVDDSNKQAYIKLYADIFENSFVGPGFERFMKTYEKLTKPLKNKEKTRSKEKQKQGQAELVDAIMGGAPPRTRESTTLAE